MALLGNYITIQLDRDVDGNFAIIAESTSVDAQFAAEAMEATSQTNGLKAVFEAGKNKITVSGDYLSASTGGTLDILFAMQNAGTKFPVKIYRSDTLVLSTEGVFTSLNQSGALSDSLATGAYSIECDSAALDITAPVYSSSEVGNVDAGILVMAYSEALDSSSTPATTDFSISDGSPNAVTDVAVSGTAVTLTLTNDVLFGDTVTASYTKGANPLQDASANECVNLVTESVTNNVPA